MPTAPPRPCSIPRCSGMSTHRGYCEKHKRERQTVKRPRDTRESAHKRGYNRHHRKLRLVIMSEQPICAGQGCTKAGVELDHIDSDVYNVERSNLQMLCKSCHSKKTNRTRRVSKAV